MANQAIRQEINLVDLTQSSTGNRGISQLDTTQYSGSPTYYFEVVNQGAVGQTGTVTLRRNGTTTDDATLNAPNDANWHVSRVSFTPPAGQTAYFINVNQAGTGVHTVNCARIIVLQSETAISQTETQIEIGNSTAALTNTAIADVTNPKFWTYTAANWDGTKTFLVEVSWSTSAANTTTIRLCRTSDNATNVTIVNAQTSTTLTRTRVSFTPVDGETYKIRSLSSTTKSSYLIRTGKIIVDQSSTPTKLEPQFLLLNTNDSNATGVQNRLTTWNSSEWDAGSGSITYKHLMDSDNASNSIKLYNVTDADDVTSTVTGSGQQVSSALTVGAGELVTAKNYDCWVLNTTGVIAASRLQVLYVYVAPAAGARRVFISKW